MKNQTKLWALALFMMSGGFANAQKEWQADSLELFQIDEDSHLRGGVIRQTSGSRGVGCFNLHSQDKTINKKRSKLSLNRIFESNHPS